MRAFWRSRPWTWLACAILVSGEDILLAEASANNIDPCSVIAGKKWTSPQEVRACFTSFAVQPELKANIIDVVNKTMAFYTSVNYARLAPPPFSEDVHEDILADLARISTQEYASDFELHIDLSRTFKRANDGHCAYINLCYDAAFLSYVPTPLVLLTDSYGEQSVHIAPEAYNVSAVEFSDQIDVWRDALPKSFDGDLSLLSGAKVLLINGEDPFVAVDDNAHITGGYQAFGTRQNSFFSSYKAAANFSYELGNFAQTSLPLIDSVTLTIQRTDGFGIENITLPYRSRIGPAVKAWNDSESFFANNCLAVEGTNGFDIYGSSLSSTLDDIPFKPASLFQQQPMLNPRDVRKHALNVLMDIQPLSDIALPGVLAPSNPLNGSEGVVQFFLLDDGKTGVLALGSFSSNSYESLQENLLRGLSGLKRQGATQLIVDVTNNGGGYICIAHWLHRIIAGPRPSTVPQAGLQTETRAGPLAQLIVKHIIGGADPENYLLYNPARWSAANNTPFPADFDWLDPPRKKIINGYEDAFSQIIGDECQPFDIDPPSVPLFDPKKTVIVSNGRCGSSCSLFSITMAKRDGAKTVVIGGKQDTPQQYCGTVGGQSVDFSTIDTEVKSTHLKGHPLAPPDFKTNSIQGITWRLGFGIDDPSQPEEWQDHPADLNLPLTADIVNNPVAIWTRVAEIIFPQADSAEANAGLDGASCYGCGYQIPLRG